MDLLAVFLLHAVSGDAQESRMIQAARWIAEIL